jgi:polyhydroxybutyrate depolymerase
VRVPSSSLLVLVVTLSLAACSGDDGAGGATGVASDPSPGCEAAPAAAGRSEVLLESGGQTRRYVLYVPAGLEDGQPAPLVLDVPAYSPAELEEQFSELTTPREDGTVKADEVGAVVVTPDPIGGDGFLRTWNFTGDAPGYPDDQLFFADVLADVGERTCIDRNRVLATGFAVGGVMAAIVACNPDFGIAALATVSGPYDPPSCAREAPLPVVAFHGTADPLLPFDGGAGPNVPLLGLTPATIAGLVGIVPDLVGARGSVRAWAERDGCAAEPETTAIGTGVTRESWRDCAAGGAVDLYVIEDAGHTWPGSRGMDDLVSLLGPTTAAVEATDILWDFFVARVGGPSGVRASGASGASGD